ncbi:hypothetical protein D3C81_1485620 [compost metagenome]
MLAIADHKGLRRIQPFLVQQVANQLDLVGAGAVQFAAVNHLEVMIEGEVPGDLTGELPGLGRRDVKRAALTVKGLEQFRHTFEDQVFVKAGDTEAFPVKIHRLPRLGFIEAVELHEGLQQGWADEVLEPRQVRLVDAQFGQGILDRTGNAQARVGQGAVKVEKDILLVHGGLGSQVHSGRS